MEELVLQNDGIAHDILFDFECAENGPALLQKVVEANVPLEHNILAFQLNEDGMKLTASFPELPKGYDRVGMSLFIDLRTYPEKPKDAEVNSFFNPENYHE